MAQSIFSSIVQFLGVFLKSALVKNAPMGGITMHVHFAYHTQGRSCTLDHALRLVK